jgi:ribosomal protein S18 acetylase RimI-like enzyme
MPLPTITNPPVLRRGSGDDLDFIARIDREGEGAGSSFADDWPEERWAQRRGEMRQYLVDRDKFTFVLDAGSECRRVGAIFGRFVNVNDELPSWSPFRILPATLFPDDGRVCEVFQLWVDPAFRRCGLATRLKREAEREATRRGVAAIYTQTNAANEHVVALNVKLGYREVRRGPLWDEVIRVSLLKTLIVATAEA